MNSAYQAIALSLGLIHNYMKSPIVILSLALLLAAHAGMITATAAPDPIISLSANALELGSHPIHPSAASASVQINNLGTTQPLTITAATTITGGSGFNILTSLPFTIPAGGSAPLDVAFTPGSTPGGFSATLKIHSDDLDSGTQSLPLTAYAGKAAILLIHAHPDDEYIFGGGTLPFYTQVRNLPVAVCSMVTRNQNGSYPLLGGGVTDRIAELHNALDVYAGQSPGSGTTDALGYYQTGNITMVEGGLRDSGSYNNKDATKSWIKWDNSVGNSDGLADGRYAAAYTVARAIRRFRPEVVMTVHDFEGDYGHADHTASAIATAEGYELAADANVDIDGLPAWQAKKLYIRGDDTDNRNTITYSGASWGTFTSDGGMHSLFHDHFEDLTIGGSSPRDIANLGQAQHFSQADHPAMTVLSHYAKFHGSYSEWFTLYRTEIGSDTIVPNFTISGDHTNTTYSGWTRGDFFENIIVFPDLDEDTLPDAWETAHSVSDPTADDDGDGLSNLDEFVSGLHPNQIDRTSMTFSTDGTSIQFTVPTATGTGYDALTRTYKLVHSTDLQDWSDVVMQGTTTGSPITYNSIPQDGGSHFYRLILSIE